MSDLTTAESAATLPPPNEASAAEEIGPRADTVWTRGEGAAPAIARVASQSVRGVGGRVAIVAGCRGKNRGDGDGTMRGEST